MGTNEAIVIMVACPFVVLLATIAVHVLMPVR